jgi:hypothetical protein
LAFAATDDQKDFSGRWKMDRSRSESAHQAVPIGAVMLVIQQTATELRVETITTPRDASASTSAETLTYKLDGSENIAPSKSGVEIKTRAKWDGPKLVLEAGRTINGAPVTTQHVLSLDAGGKELSIDKTLRIQHGYQTNSGNNTGRGRDVFVKELGETRGAGEK